MSLGVTSSEKALTHFRLIKALGAQKSGKQIDRKIQTEPDVVDE
jgi:hypothetical protein